MIDLSSGQSQFKGHPIDIPLMRIKLRQGGTIHVGGIQSDGTEGFHLLNLSGQPMTYVFRDEIETITVVPREEI